MTNTFKFVSFLTAPIFLLGCSTIQSHPGKEQFNSTLIDRPFLSSKPVALTTSFAAADSITTYIALSQGATEKNALINASPAGLLGVFLLKTGLVYYANQQEEGNRNFFLKIMAGAWGGASVNNLLVIAGATNPVSLLGGFIFGVGAYHYQDKLLAQESFLKNSQKYTYNQPISSIPTSFGYKSII